MAGSTPGLGAVFKFTRYTARMQVDQPKELDMERPTPYCVRYTGGLPDQECWCGACDFDFDEPEEMKRAELEAEYDEAVSWANRVERGCDD